MYKLDLPIDTKEAAAIELRRRREKERQERIFDSRIRQIGIDDEALKHQVEEKKLRELVEKQRDLVYAADAARNDRIACLLEKRQHDDERELAKNLNEFRSIHQQPESRREFDLYDPNAFKLDRPARVSDDDPRCGVASLQKFDGEDLNLKARMKYQREQLQNWFDRQIEERNRAENAKKEADRLYDLKRRELDQRACELQKAEEECRRAINVAMQRYNKLLKEESDQKALLKAKQTEDDNMTEICNAIYGDFLSENPAQAISAFGINRIIPERYKGMTLEQIKDIRKYQEEQIKEKQRQLAREKQGDEEWDNQILKSARLGLLIEREIERSTREINRKVAEKNLQLAQEQKSFQDYLNKELYTNQPTGQYFTQFNTTSR
uniref:RIB43A-like with coiled-coils protein 2 n=1 Tax=Schistosoma mansoni TaxID=6183 RepID=A0A5K4F881_SCHMA